MSPITPKNETINCSTPRQRGRGRFLFGTTSTPLSNTGCSGKLAFPTRSVTHVTKQENNHIGESRAYFYGLPRYERRALCSMLLNEFLEMRGKLDRMKPADLEESFSIAKIRKQLQESVDFWRDKMHAAAAECVAMYTSKNGYQKLKKHVTTGAGRSPAIKAHGCAAFALGARSTLKVSNAKSEPLHDGPLSSPCCQPCPEFMKDGALDCPFVTCPMKSAADIPAIFCSSKERISNE